MARGRPETVIVPRVAVDLLVRVLANLASGQGRDAHAGAC